MTTKELIKNNTYLISALLHSRTQTHIYHLRTDSYSTHKALEEYYTKIGKLLDSYAEVFQGTYGLLNGYETFSLNNNPNNSIKYLTGLTNTLQDTMIPDDNLKNILDTINELIYRTIYKLKNLK